MTAMRLVRTITIGICVFIGSFAIAIAIYASIMDGRFVERGIEPAIGDSTFASLVALPIAICAGFLVWRYGRKLS
jgi:hypothetical protein